MTETRELGVLEGPVLCFGGPYSNAQATEAVLAEARARDIPPERTICTGDVVAYGGQPKETVDLIRASGIHVVMGNCEESIGFDAADCGCGFDEESDCADWSRVWYAHALTGLDDGAKAWMRELPRQIRFTLRGRRFAVIHGGAENISEYIFASTPGETKSHGFHQLDRDGPVDGVIAGHSGLPFTELLGHRLWLNAGAIGMPANDGTPRGWFSVLTPAAGGIDIALYPLDYDHRAAARALRNQSPDLPYAKTMEDGLWPNMAVMPEAERRLQGRPLAPKPVHWPGRPLAAAEVAHNIRLFPDR